MSLSLLEEGVLTEEQANNFVSRQKEYIQEMMERISEMTTKE